MKKLFFLVILSLGLTSISYGDAFDGFFDDWTDEHLCGWMDKPEPPAYMVDEVSRRSIACEGGKVLTKKEEIIIEIIEELKVITSADEDLILGISASRNGEFDQAIDYFYSSILKNPNNATTHYFLGKSLIRIGLDSEAEKKYRKALELNPSYSEVYNSLGLLYSSQGSFDEAIDSYTEAISLNQNYSSPYINRGLIFYNLGSYQKALFDFTRALEIEPKSSVALINRANVYSAMGAKEAVCEDLNKLCSLGNCTSLDNLKDSGYCKY